MKIQRAARLWLARIAAFERMLWLHQQAEVLGAGYLSSVPLATLYPWRSHVCVLWCNLCSDALRLRS